MVKVARDYERIEIGRVWQVDFRNYSSSTGTNSQTGVGSGYWIRAQRPTWCVHSAFGVVSGPGSSCIQ